MKDLSHLKEDVELKFGRKITTYSAFDSLFLAIKSDTGKEISVSTLKRIWGYVKTQHEPRHEILSILSQYLGYKDWNDYMSSSNSDIDFSDFLSKDILETKHLIGGELIQIAWAPNRICELKYLGNSLFEVKKALNAKIKEGDIFYCSIIAKGEPLMCSSIVRDGELLAECYIAARNRGLNKLLIRRNS